MTIDEPEGSFAGGVIAAPVFKEITSQTLNYLGVTPEGFADEVVVAKSDLNHDSRKISAAIDGVRDAVKDSESEFDGLVPDFRGRTMRSVIHMASKNNINIDISGSGVAMSQSPKPGKALKADSIVKVVFK